MTTIGVESKSKQIEKDGESVTVQLWDTAGQER
jgi:GTPase SAR1 family protein